MKKFFVIVITLSKRSSPLTIMSNILQERMAFVIRQ